MFKTIQNGAYWLLITDKLLCYIPKPKRSEGKIEDTKYSWEILKEFPDKLFYIDFNPKEAFKVENCEIWGKNISFKDVHKELRNKKFNDIFEAKLLEE